MGKMPPAWSDKEIKLLINFPMFFTDGITQESSVLDRAGGFCQQQATYHTVAQIGCSG